MQTASNRHDIPAFMQTQLAFTAAVRDPDNRHAPEDVPSRRMAVYQELVYNNIDDALSSVFPVLRKISSDKRWHGLMRDFLVEHRAKTPLFTELAQEFIRYLEHVRSPRKEDYPFMLELAHYEWAELALGISEVNIDEAEIQHDEELLDGVPVLSPLAWLCSYHYPVHRIGPEFIPEEPGESLTWMLVYRDRNDRVGFMELNPVTAQLLQRMKENRHKSGKMLLEEIATALQHPNPKAVILGGAEILHDLQARDIILGSRIARG